MGMRSIGEIVQRLRWGLVELLQHEQLRPADTDVFFRPARRLAQRVDDPADGIQHLSRVVRLAAA